MPGVDPHRWQTLSPLLEKALDMSDEQRLVWLASLRSENSSLADELHNLLESNRVLASEGFLDVPVIQASQATGLAGQTVGSYRLVAEIGRGGMGTVWLAERNDGRFERKVAIKFLNIALLGKEGEERFRREGLILGRLAHPHIAELIDAGVSPSGQPYLILEYVSGDHIDQYCDSHRLDIPSRIRLFLDVLEAVEHAHSNQVVHRDLKPSNVLVRNDGEAKLLDFGIAKLLEIDENTYQTQLTLEGGRALTPDYAAPEQLTGQPISPATDIYALGVLLYVLLTGRHPTTSDTHAPADLIRAVLETEPLKPSEAVLRKKGEIAIASTNAARRGTSPEGLSQTLRGDLDTIVGKSIKKDSRERYSRAGDLANDLRCYLQNKPISARPDSLTYRAGKYLRRHRAPIATAFLIVLTLVIGLVASRLNPSKGKALPQIKQRRLTANPQDLPVLSSVISPDGAYLGYSDQNGLHVQSLETSAPIAVALPLELMNSKAVTVGGWYPDSKRLLVVQNEPVGPVSLWSISISGPETQKVAAVDALWGSAKVSPDGTKIAYTRIRTQSGARELWLMGSHGESPRLIQAAGPQSSFSEVAWVPGGNRLVYIYSDHRADPKEVAVKSCDLDGKNITTQVKDLRLDGFAWTTPERFVYSRTTDPGGTDSDNLFELRVDQNGVPQGNPQPITNWSGFAAFNFSSSSDGRHLAFLRGGYHISLYVAELSSDGTRTVNTQPFNADENVNIPLAWTPDSNQVIFSSKRADHRLIYRRNFDQKTPAQLLTNYPGMDVYLARPTPDGTAMIVEGRPSGKPQMMSFYRTDLDGGNPRLLFNMEAFVLYWCAVEKANFCVLGDMSPSSNELVITHFDPTSGERHEALRIALESGTSARLGEDYFWQLSPDGRNIAIVKRHDTWVKVVPLTGGPTKTINAKILRDLNEVNWAADSQALFVSSATSDGASVIRLDLNGQAHTIFHDRRAVYVGVTPSRDGKRLAIWSDILEANAWIIDDF